MNVDGALPCDVQALLSTHCQACHASTPVGGAPMSLMTLADLAAKNATGAVIAERCLARMTSTTQRMPPAPAAAVTATEIAAFQAWITAGIPAGSCAPGNDPFGGPVVCTSGKTWSSGNTGSPLMHPGGACIACHASNHGDDDRGGGDDAPRFSIAGTVYPTGHEPDDCDGAPAAAAAVVEVTDAAGKVTTLPVNAAGNFFTTAAVAAPFHVAVVAGGKRRAMPDAPPSGDCNSCHTRDGANGAPGRIALP